MVECRVFFSFGWLLFENASLLFPFSALRQRCPRPVIDERLLVTDKSDCYTSPPMACKYFDRCRRHVYSIVTFDDGMVFLLLRFWPVKSHPLEIQLRAAPVAGVDQYFHFGVFSFGSLTLEAAQK